MPSRDVKGRPRLAIAFDLVSGVATIMTSDWSVTVEGITTFEDALYLGHYIQHESTKKRRRTDE